MITFKNTLVQIGPFTVVKIPRAVSKQFPSRGIVYVEGTMNKMPLKQVVEPDGKLGHWFKVDSKLSKAAKLQVGDTVSLAIEPSVNWPEPTVPADIKKALAASSKDVQALWKDITPMARWDWTRWITGTKNPETRAKRTNVAIDKLSRGERRPCCFNRNGCYDPVVSKNGWLIESNT